MDTDGDRTGDSGPNTRQDTITVTEAARRLNVTPDAIRARIRRGTLEAVKRDGTWHIVMPADGDDTTQQATQQDTTPATDATVGALLELIADLTRQNADYAGAAAAWQARAGYLQERLAALEAGPLIVTPEGQNRPVANETEPARMESPAAETPSQRGAWARLVRWLRGS